MEFKPYSDELEMINKIHKFNNNDYTIVRLTKTMIDKNIIDANALVRNLLKKYGLVDFSKLINGGSNGIKLDSELLLDEGKQIVKTNFYRAATRGDERFSIGGLRNLVTDRKFYVGDLIYITVNKYKEKNRITLINVTHNIPNEKFLSQYFGIDIIEDSLSRLIPKLKMIFEAGYHKNIKGIGKIAPKDAGDTFEALLGIKTNNKPTADFEELIELKVKRLKTLSTLFTLRPRFDGTPVAEYEPKDRSRVSAFTRLYGYETDKHAGYKSLYVTIGSEDAPQNTQGLYLFVNEDISRVEIRRSDENNKIEVVAYWSFKDLEKELIRKHPATLWIKAEDRMVGNQAEFRYTNAILTRSPQFMTFLSLIKIGIITYDWRGYTTPSGKYSGKNHGNAWRIKDKQRNLLFGEFEEVNI